MESTAKVMKVDEPVRLADAGAIAPAKPKSKAMPIVGAVTALAVLVIGVALFVTRGQETTDDAQVEADVVPLAARVGGQVLRVLVADNAQVKKGDALVELDPADYAARLKQAEGELSTAVAQAAAAEANARVAEANAKGGFSTARARVGGSTAAVSSAGAQVESARAQLDRAQAEEKRAQQDLTRTKALVAANSVTQERLDNAQAAADSAEAALRGARAQLAAAIDQQQGAVLRVDEARGQLRQSEPVAAMVAAARANADLAQAKVKTSEASLDQARLALGYTRILAPADGVVTRLSARVGQSIGAGQAVAELVPPEVYVVANFKETQVGAMRAGQHVEVRVDAFSHARLSGEVQSLAGGTGARFALLPADNASGNFVKVVQRVPVRIALKEIPRDVALRAGLSADVTVYTR